MDLAPHGQGEPQEDIEAELERRLRGVRLVLEVGLDPTTVARVREVATAVASGSDEPELTLETRLPAVLATWLVADGVDFYDGSFWPRITVPGLDGTKLGQGFERAVRTLHLEPFDDLVDDNALRYVAPILAHGGIPKYSTRDYVRLVSRELRRHADASAEELVALWRSRRSAFVDIDTPVRRFLMYGGAPALDLLDRTIELLKLGVGDVQPGGAERLGLPPHVVEAYLTFGSDHVAVAAGTAARLPRPAVRFDPWGGLGPVVELPPAASRFRGATWRVAGDGRSRVFDVSLLDSQVVPVGAAGAWEITFQEASGLHRDYAFECLAESPIVCFDPTTGDYISDTRPIALDEIWAVVPEGTELRGLLTNGATAPLSQLSELPKPAGSWAGFQALHLSLDGVRAVTLRLDTPGAERAATGLIRVIRPADRPALRGSPLTNVVGIYGDPVFAVVPTLRVPNIPGFGDERWSLRVKGTQAEFNGTLEDCERASDVITLPTHEALLFGAVDVSLRGPLGSDLRVRFVVVPGLSVEVPTRILLPSDTTPAFVTASAVAGVDFAESASSGSVRVQIPSSGAEVPLVARHGSDEVALRVPVPRLQWAAKRGESVPTLGSQRLTIDRDDIESGITESLVVATHGGGTAMALELWGDRGLLQQTAFMTPSRDGRWVFDLGPFRDTVRAEPTARLPLKLAIETDLVVVADVVAGVSAHDFTVTQDDDDPAATVIRFSQARSLRGRVARLWSLQRPWDVPISLPIPDNIADSVVVPGAIASPGRYRVEIAVEDPWTRPLRPRAGAVSTADVVVGSAASDLARRVELETAGPAGLLEFAVINGMWPDELQGRLVAEVTALALDGAAAMLSDLQPIEIPSRPLRVLAGLAMFDLPTALDAIADRFSEERMDAQTILSIVLLSLTSIRLVIPPRVSERTIRTVWQACPSLACLIDVPCARAGDVEAADRCLQFLGWRPGQEAVIRPGMRLTELELKPVQLRLIRERLGLVPREILSWDSWALASFDWLLAAREQGGIQEWWRRNGWLQAASFDDAKLSTDVRSRAPQRHPDAWAALPQATLAAAIQVMLSDSDRPAAAEALREATAFASRLAIHDLCLARVVVSAADESETTDHGGSLGARVLPDLAQGQSGLSMEPLARIEWEKATNALEPGSSVRARVVRIGSSGVFVDVLGALGLIHRSEVGWTRTDDLEAVFHLGQTVDAVVVAVDREAMHISLSTRLLTPDPWPEFERVFSPGTEVAGVVTEVTNFGAFVRLDAGVDGLIHISEISDEPIESRDPVGFVRRHVQPGQPVTALVLSVDPDKRRLSLTLRPPRQAQS